MIKAVFMEQTKRKYIIQGIILLIIFMFLYTLLDYFNGGYQEMIKNYGLFLVIINILINLIMSLASALMLNLSTALVLFTQKEGKGSFFTFFSLLFGLLTYGCTPCVISFFATLGITFAVATLPLAGLPYKLISLLILAIGFGLLLFEINRFSCKVDLKQRRMLNHESCKNEF